MKRCLVCAVLLCMISSTDLFSDENVNVMEGPYDLQAELFLIQLVAPPVTTNTFEYDSGVFLYVPDLDSDSETALFTEGLIFKTDESGNLIAPVSVFEDLETRDTVYLNSENEIIFRIPPLYGYNPYWVIDALYPGTEPVDSLLDQYDPSRVVMKAVLLPYEQEKFSELLNKSSLPSVESLESQTVVGTLPVAESLVDAVTTYDMKTEEADDSNSNTNESTSVVRKTKVKRNIYVDKINGDDEWSGKNKNKVEDDGPKSSIKEGLKAVKDKGRLFVAEGRYAEKMDIRGKNVTVLIKGTVVVSGKAAGSRKNPETAVPSDPSVQTNLTVTASIGM